MAAVSSPFRSRKALFTPSVFRRRSSASSRRESSPGSSTDLSDQSEDGKGPLGLNLLCSVAEPLVDFIFVHGLGGGSRKTWAKSTSTGDYWPRDWLPRDVDFKNVRVYSFGYKADWWEKDSILDIQDFARSLLSEMQDNPDIRRTGTRVVLIGHSMGGIVIKKAYILARQDPAFTTLASRIHTLYFLATPHRGSEMAGTLTNILKVIRGPKRYVSEIKRNSSSIAAINDAFRNYAGDLQLRSFYETEPSSMMLLNTVVVDKDSAILGYDQERAALLNADHRGMCKFDRPSDPNYQTLRNALSATVDTIVADVTNIKQEAPCLDIHCLSAFSGISVQPEDDLAVLDDARVAGSCEWLTSKKDFIDWRGAWSGSPPILWLRGSAASGKSVLCSHVIGNLAANKLKCSYFFFKHNSTGKSSVRDCLKSLAYQMALDDDSAISRLLELEKDDLSWERGNDQALWSKLFLRCLFQTDPLRHHYWVIDALDECNNFQALFQLISKMPKNLRILISSRKTQDIELCFTGLGDLVVHQDICVSDTIGDIKLFIASRMDRLPVDGGESRTNLEDRIITKSAGSFLWVRLVIQELERTFSKEAIEDVLSEVPQGMNQIYARILTNMTKLGRGTIIAKAILTWSICASRPLSLCEVQHALTLDIHQTVSNLEKSIPLICGQLVFVDHNSRVQIIHQTARDFLLQQKLSSEFKIDRQESHTRIALTCLKFLSGDWFKGQRLQRQRAATRLIPGLPDSTTPDTLTQEAAFADYACHFFSDHLYRSSSANPDSLECLWSFLNRNVLSWIEYIARTGDLSSLTRTAKNMRAFLERRAQHFPPISWQVERVEAWITDLIRISAKFRTQLLASPSSIHSLIPPMCPSDSIITRTYSTPQRGLLVKGLTKQTWDDCLARIDFHDAQTSAIANGERLFAVGLSNGKVRLYHSMSLQEQNIIDHGERVKVLQFSSEDRFLASSGLRSIRLWDPRSGNQMWTFDISHQTMALVFKADDELIDVASRANYILTIGVQDGVEINRTDLVEGSHDDFLERQPSQSPSLAVFSSDCNLLAVSYRGRPIRLFDVENGRFTLSFSREVAQSSGGPATHYSVDAMVFNPSSEINVLIASYGDGELTVYDLWSAEPKHRLSGVFAHSLICSPDGRSLITGSSQGTIQIFDFGGVLGDKLSMIYQIDVYEDGIKALSFGQDSLRFTDIRASQCRVWEPAVLVRKDLDEGSHSELSQPLPSLSKRSGIFECSHAPEITAIFCNADGKTVFCGRQDGSVLSYRTLDGEKTGILYSHAANVTVVAIALASAQDHRLISADESGRLLIAKVSMEKEKWLAGEILADVRLNESITTILVSPAADRFLVVGEKTDALWTTQGESIGERMSSESKTVICHPLHPELFIVLGHQVARLFRWANFEEVTSPEGIMLDRLNDSTFGSGTALVSVRGSSLLSEMRKVMGEPKSNRLVCWQTSDFEAGSISVTSLAGFEELGSRIDHVIDVVGTLLLFLDTDLWVCSLDLRTFRATPQVKRHFFILSEWRGGSGRVLMHYTSMRDFIFAKEGELVVIKRGLEFSETMELSKGKETFALRVDDFSGPQSLYRPRPRVKACLAH